MPDARVGYRIFGALMGEQLGVLAMVAIDRRCTPDLVTRVHGVRFEHRFARDVPLNFNMSVVRDLWTCFLCVH